MGPTIALTKKILLVHFTDVGCTPRSNQEPVNLSASVNNSHTQLCYIPADRMEADTSEIK